MSNSINIKTKNIINNINQTNIFHLKYNYKKNKKNCRIYFIKLSSIRREIMCIPNNNDSFIECLIQ